MSNSMPSKSVGRSWRTPLKHDVMWALVGEESGAAPRLPGIKALVWYDLTAGDAASVDGVPWERGCSVGILIHHAALCSLPVRILLYEKNPNVYVSLLTNLGHQLKERGWTQWPGSDDVWTHANGSTVKAFLSPGEHADISWVNNSTAVLVFNDPNNVDGWAMRPTFPLEIVKRKAWCFRTLSTLGCNVGGLKRRDVEERARWFTFPESVRGGTPRYRDILLAAIDRDDSQWAYLVSTSEKWRVKTEGFFTKAANEVDRTVSTAWYRAQPTEFSELTARLFLTKKERDGS